MDHSSLTAQVRSTVKYRLPAAAV